MSSAELHLKTLLRFWMVAFGLCELVFLFLGQKLLSFMNQISLRLLPDLPLLPVPEDRFWLALVSSLMVTLVFLCYWGQKQIRQNKFVVLPILVSKFASTFFFSIFFLFHMKSLAYFVGAVVDGAIFLITLHFYRRATT